MLKRLTLLFFLALAAPAGANVAPGWAPTGSMATPRSGARAVVLDSGKVLVAGGNFDGDAELFDPATGTWSPAGSMGGGRAGFGMVKLPNGKVLVVGGDPPPETSLLYDPATNAWSRTDDPAYGRSDMPLILLSTGKALVTGGNNEGAAELYDPATGMWSPAGTLTPPRGGHGAVALPGGRAMIFGGYSDMSEILSSSQRFNGGTGWSAGPSLSMPRSGFRYTTWPDGTVLVVGGGGDESNELYDPVRDRWTTAAPLPWRSDHRLTTLANGKAMVVGGFDLEGNHAQPVIYDPGANAWAAAGTPGAMGRSPTATLLPDGRVLVAGGTDPNPNPNPPFPPLPEGSTVARLWTPATSLTAAPAPAFTVAGTTAEVTLTNKGDSPLLTEAFAVDTSDFAVDPGTCRAPVAPGASCAASVRFTPTAEGARTATLRFSANTAAGSHTVALSGVTAAPLPGPPPAVADLDADDDGVLDVADRCRDLLGPAFRQGCPTGLLADPSIAYRQVRGGIRVVAYYVKATTGARVVVKCSKGCKQTVTKGRGSKRVRITRLNGKRLANGTKLTVTVSLPGRLTTTVIDRVSRSRRVEGRPRCAPVGC